MTASFLRIVAGTTMPADEPDAAPRRNHLRTAYRSRTGDRERNMHTLAFRSRQAILNADETTLLEDVSCDLEKAQRKLNKIKLQIKKVARHAAEELRILTAADAKLSAAVVAALLSRRPMTRERPVPHDLTER